MEKKNNKIKWLSDPIWRFRGMVFLVFLLCLIPYFLYIKLNEDVVPYALLDLFISTGVGVLIVLSCYRLFRIKPEKTPNRKAIDNPFVVERLFRALNAANEGVLVVQEFMDPTGTVLFANKELGKILNTSPQKLMGASYLNLFSDKAKYELEKQFDESGNWDGKSNKTLFLDMIDDDGDPLPVEIGIAPYTRDHVSLKIMFVWDIRNRVKLEERLEDYTTRLEWMVNQRTEELMESEIKYRTIMESMDDIVISLDTTGKITYMNPAWDKCIGLDRDEVLGSHFVDNLHPNDFARLSRFYMQSIQERVSIARMDFRHKVKGNDWRSFVGNLSILYDLDKNIVGSVLTCRDVTDQLKMEEWFAHSERMESAGLLASGLAHDFNNLFHEMIGFIRRIKRNPDSVESIKSDAQAVEGIIKRATSFVRQLLSFASSQEKHEEKFNINESIKRIYELVSRSFPKNVKIDLLLKSTYSIEGDPNQFDQVFLNFLINARDAMPDGGKITIKTENRESEEGHSGQVTGGKHVKISISDTGAGIDPDTIPKIFDPFFTTKENGKGTGLGLSTVYGVVKNHYGMINVESEVGKGTEFIVLLPSKGNTGEMEQIADESDESEKTVLLVDDDKDILSLTAEALQQEGYRVLTASTGLEAVETYKAFYKTINITVMDRIMPEMDGISAAKKLRQISPDCPVIISTGQAGKITDERLLNRKISRILEKPFMVEDLIQNIEELLKHARK